MRFIARGESGHVVTMNNDWQVRDSKRAAHTVEELPCAFGKCTRIGMISIPRKQQTMPKKDFSLQIEGERETALDNTLTENVIPTVKTEVIKCQVWRA